MSRHLLIGIFYGILTVPALWIDPKNHVWWLTLTLMTIHFAVDDILDAIKEKR